MQLTHDQRINQLLAVAVCPVSHGSLTSDDKGTALLSAQAKLRFAIQDGCVDLRPETASPILDAAN